MRNIIFLFEYIFLNLIFFCDGKAEFSASLLHSSVSQDLSEIIFRETFFTIVWQIESSKEKHLFEIEIL